ncbi:MAG: hypothetical protein WC901_02175 [Candidatus Margulisiibacteriota bacterium]
MVNWPSLGDIKTSASAYARKAVDAVEQKAEDAQQYAAAAQRYVEEQILRPVSIAVESTEETIARLPNIIDKKAGNFVENHPKAVKAALIGVAATGFLLSPNKILALEMLGGCAGPQEGPCGCPPISDENGDPIDPELKNAMCATIEEAEKKKTEDDSNPYYPPLTCKVDEIIVAPKQTITEACGEYGKFASGCFKEQNNKVFILDSQLILQPATPFSTTLSLTLSSQQILLHEIIHSRQELNEKNDDLGYQDFEENICAQTNYVNYDGYFGHEATLAYDSARLSHYSLATCADDHAETLSWLYVDPKLSLASSNPDYIERVNFAEDQWGTTFFPPDYPGQINATYHRTTMPPYHGTFAIFQDAVTYLEYEHYPYFGSDGTLNPYCPFYFYPYDTQSNNFPETPIEINMPFPVKNSSPDSEYLIGGECSLEMDTVSFAASKMASIYSYDGVPTLIISDWETGEYIQTELDLPPAFDMDWSLPITITIYDNQIFILPKAIDLAKYDATTELSFPRYDLDSGTELAPLFVTDLGPLIDNGYTDELYFSHEERDPANPYLLTYFPPNGSTSETPPGFEGLFLINLSPEPNQPALISAETTYEIDENTLYNATVSPNGEITYFTREEDLYTSDKVDRLYKKPLGTETRQLVNNTNYSKYISAASGHQFTIGETIYFVDHTDCSEDNPQACEYSNATILEIAEEPTTLTPE